MNKQDISRMLSQTDEKYLDDILDEKVKISSRRRSYIGMGAAAAVIALSLCAVAAFDRGTSGIADGVPPVFSQTVVRETDALDALYPAEFGSDVPHPEKSTSDDPADLSGDYGAYFRKDGKKTFASYEYDTNGYIYKYDAEYVRKAVKFYTAGNTAANAGIYTDEKGVPVYTEILLIGFRESGDALNPYARIQMSAEGKFFNRFMLEEPMQRNGVDLYGFECTDDRGVDSENSLDIYFENGGTAYSITFRGTDYKTAIEVFDSIIANGLSVSDFDLEEAGCHELYSKQTLEKANHLTAFEGIVPQIEEIPSEPGNISLEDGAAFYTVRYDEKTLAYEMLNLRYVSETGGRYIFLEYKVPYTQFYRNNFMTELPDKTDFRTLSYDKLDGMTSGYTDKTYSFSIQNIDGYDGYIDVEADCTKDELWTLLTSAFPELGAAPEDTQTPPDDIEPEDTQELLHFRTPEGEKPRLTMDDVRELAKKGDALTWSDFDPFECAGEVGSGLFILSYPVDDGYFILIGGADATSSLPPWYVYLNKTGGEGYIDIRTDDIDNFLE